MKKYTWNTEMLALSNCWTVVNKIFYIEKKNAETVVTDGSMFFLFGLSSFFSWLNWLRLPNFKKADTSYDSDSETKIGIEIM